MDLGLGLRGADPRPLGGHTAANVSCLESPTAGMEEPCQLNTNFSGQKFKTESFERPFLASWFTKYKWLHNIFDEDYVFSFLWPWYLSSTNQYRLTLLAG